MPTFRKPNDYDDVKVGGDFRPLPKGGYVVRIAKAEATESSGGVPMIHIAYDIAEGEYANYFTDLYKNRKARSERPFEVKYPFEGQKWILVYDKKGKTNSDFKGFCTALEDSGTKVWMPNGEFNVNALSGAKVGLVFRREENEYQGKYTWRTMPWRFRSVDVIRKGDVFVPEDKAIERNTAPTIQPGMTYSYNTPSDIPDSFSAASDDIPF